VDIIRTTIRRLLPFALTALFAGAPAYAQQAQEPFTPTVGQAGKDVVWVPTPEAA
jgi:hypothetical protein